MEDTKYDVFISYSRKDYVDERKNVIPGNKISRILDVLNEAGITFWIDEKGIYCGDEFSGIIADAIEKSDALIFISSEASNNATWTIGEIATAQESHKKIIPVRIDSSQYHKSLRVRLNALDYIDFTSNPDKALRKLVSTIKNIDIKELQLNPLVVSLSVSREQKVNGVFLSKSVLSIFNSKDIRVSAEEFEYLLNKLDCESENGYQSIKNNLLKLKKISEERNYEVRRSRIERLVSDIKEENVTLERSVSVMYILLKMYLYFCLNDIREVVIIQKELNNVKYELTFVEKNADAINEIADKTVRGATFIAGLTATIMGKGGSAARAGIYASTRGEKIKIVKTPQKIMMQQKAFNAFKTIVKGLNFCKI